MANGHTNRMRMYPERDNVATGAARFPMPPRPALPEELPDLSTFSFLGFCLSVLVALTVACVAPGLMAALAGLGTFVASLMGAEAMRQMGGRR